MELGSLKVRCQHQNLLHQAVHEENGLAWSDGNAIFLAPISIHQGEVENQPAVKLGEFDRGVRSVHWSDTIEDGLCYMCVVHDKNISLWKVEGSQPKLTFKQVRKVNVQPLQQGCLWCPRRDILCVLCKDQCSLYYSHLRNKGSHVLPQLQSEAVRCGTWLTDGSRLVICAGTSLLVFTWSDLDKSITNYSGIQWNVPGLDGRITTVAPVSSDKALFAAELPLESLCKQQDAFVLPDLLNTQSNGPLSEELGGDVIRPKQTALSVTDTLFNLPRTSQTSIQDTSQLVCVQFREDRDPEKISGSKVKGILTPDILLYEPRQKLIIVGSNTQTLLQVFSVGEKQLTKTAEIELDKNERAKGISCLPEHSNISHTGILLLIGQKSPTDSAFLPASSVGNMKGVLKFFTLKSGNSLSEKKKVVQSMSVPNLTSDPKNGFRSNTDLGEPPKRPIRKKKSMNKPSSTKSSGDLDVQMNENGGNSSEDSSDTSPRQLGVDMEQGKATPVEEQLKAHKYERVEKSRTPDVQPQLLVSSSRNGDVKTSSGVKGSSYVEHLKLDQEDIASHSSSENSPRDITVHIGSVSLDNTSKIVPLGPPSPKGSLEVEKADFNSQERNFRNSDYQVVDGQHSALVEEYLAQKRAVRQQQLLKDSEESSRSSVSMTTKSPSKTDDHLESLEDIETLLKDQNQKIVKLQEQMSNLSRRVDDSTMVFPTRYQTLKKPELINIAFRCSDGFEVKKTFVLDNGRLQLEPLKLAFSLQTVELIIDDEPCVTGCNIDGYIPMRFTPGSTLYISGKPAPR